MILGQSSAIKFFAFGYSPSLSLWSDSRVYMVHSKKSITNDGDLLTSKLCIAFDNMSYVGYNSGSFMDYTAKQMTLILHDSGVLCNLHILDHELDHFSCPVLLHDSNVVVTHKIS